MEGRKNFSGPLFGQIHICQQWLSVNKQSVNNRNEHSKYAVSTERLTQRALCKSKRGVYKVLEGRKVRYLGAGTVENKEMAVSCLL